MTFKTWIKQFKGEDTPIGDLAEDICRDTSFPATRSLEKMFEYLISRNACTECIRTFAGAYVTYMTVKSDKD